MKTNKTHSQSEDERWKDWIKNPRYKVSTLGRVWDTSAGRDCEVGQFLSGIPQYYYVNLNTLIAGKVVRKMVRLHRVVAETWLIPDDDPKRYTVDHIDRDKLNNKLSNLRWATRKEQNHNRFCRIDLVYMNEHMSLTELSEMLVVHMKSSYNLDIDKSLINVYLNGKLKDKSQTPERAVFDLILFYTHGIMNTSKGGEFIDAIYNKDIDFRYIEKAKERYKCGWSISDIIRGYQFSGFSGFIVDEVWYPTLRTMADGVGIQYGNSHLKNIKCEQTAVDEYRRYMKEGRSEYFDIEGCRLSKKEAYEKYSTTESKVLRCMKDNSYTFEEAVVSVKPMRVIKWEIDGVVKRNKDWFLHFGIPPRRGNGKLSKTKDMRVVLEWSGIDTSRMEKIKPYVM